MATLTADQRGWVERAAPRVAGIARALLRVLPQARFDELESAGYEGLVQAALRYDPECGISFAAFAHYRIRGAMIDWARAQAPGLRRYQRTVRALHASQALLESEVATASGDRRALEDRIATARKLVEQAATSVLAARAMDGDPDALAGTDDPERELMGRETRRRVRDAVAALPAEERAIIEGLYRTGESMHEIASRLGVAPSTISRRHQRAMSRLAEALRA